METWNKSSYSIQNFCVALVFKAHHWVGNRQWSQSNWHFHKSETNLIQKHNSSWTAIILGQKSVSSILWQIWKVKKKVFDWLRIIFCVLLCFLGVFLIVEKAKCNKFPFTWNKIFQRVSRGNFVPNIVPVFFSPKLVQHLKARKNVTSEIERLNFKKSAVNQIIQNLLYSFHYRQFVKTYLDKFVE